MNRIKTSILILALLLTGVSSIFTEDQIGEIVYLEDGIEVVRNSETIESGYVFIGMEIENFDLMSTDDTGFAEVDITSPRCPSFNIKVSPNTTFFFEINKIGRNERTTLGMISGTLSIKVKKISGNREIEVKTESAAMGVRGTSFDVTSNPAGEILITCEEGKVSCRDNEGNELFAEPGKAVEKRPGELLREIPVAVSDLRKFRKDWYAERLEVFKVNALKAIKNYAARYNQYKRRFASTYQNLMREQAILNKWYEEDRKGTVGSSMDIMREKKKIIRHLFAIRKVLFIFERVYFRLVELEYYYKQGYGRGLIQPGLSSANFFMRFKQEKSELRKKIAKVRYIIKLYARRNEGSFPTDLFEGSESDFFKDTDFSF